MKVLITGGCGFIGSHLADFLALQEYKVIVVDNFCSGHHISSNSLITYIEKDCVKDGLDQVFLNEKPDYVIHLAAQVDVKKSMNYPVFDAELNVLGTIRILDLCRKYSVKKFVFASTSAVYGDYGDASVHEDVELRPVSFYGVSKLASEKYIDQFASHFGLSYAIFRYSNVYGPRQRSDNEGGVIPIFIRQLSNNRNPIIFGDGNQTRDFIHISDVVHANYLALNTKKNILANISSNTTNSINDLCSILSTHFNDAKAPIQIEHRSGDILHSQLDNTKAKMLLDWEPRVTLTQGIKLTVDAYTKENGR
ncbi:NAD-dependent epimerase/dehydratase family protein [Alkalihalobacillus sp. AL-G]|uniref:NAD-dependent epimerase/dehydratase family protein n=1 Tax=Alkalihalobacillus sp. AL-G TaxID=2926399 RepID=UPI0027295FC6|nr:NAD-dependent epimerase/dehydratase family protein [Alkalihalobacillus sp. AL-G]WLD94938.1 NAD-dependent epimerase/dehydratase family protein [Alkalihalobacillus sp. AL-G]